MLDITVRNASVSDRDRAIEPARTALLSIDMQNAEWSPDQAERARQDGAPEAAKRSFLERLETIVIPNQQRLQAAARAANIEVIFTVIESLTLDGREISLDHKISGLFFPKGSWEAQVIPSRSRGALLPRPQHGRDDRGVRQDLTSTAAKSPDERNGQPGLCLKRNRHLAKRLSIRVNLRRSAKKQAARRQPSLLPPCLRHRPNSILAEA